MDIDFSLDDRPLITLHDRELDRLRDSDRKLVRQLQRQYVELWVEHLGRRSGLPESEDGQEQQDTAGTHPRSIATAAANTPPAGLARRADLE